MTSQQRRLTEPLGTTVEAIGLAGLMLVATAAGTALSGLGSIGGFGDASVCVNQPRTGYSGEGWTSHLGVAARPGALLSLNGTLQACAQHPSFGQRLLYTFISLPTVLLWAAILLMIWRLIVAARRSGPFTGPVVAATRRLGWLVIIGSAAAGSAQGAATDALLNTMLTGQDGFADAILGLRAVFPVPLLAGAGLLAFARVIGRGAEMDDELQGTI